MCETSIHDVMPISYAVVETAGLAADVSQSVKQAFPNASDAVLDRIAVATDSISKFVRPGDVVKLDSIVPNSGQALPSERGVRATVLRAGRAVAGYAPAPTGA